MNDEPSIAFWVWARCLSDLVFWVRTPNPTDTMRPTWADATRDELTRTSYLAQQETQSEPMISKITRTRSLAFDLVRMLNTNAEPFQNWSRLDQRVVDQLCDLQEEFARMGDGVDAPVGKTDRSEGTRADTSKNSEIVPTSRDRMTQDLLTHQFNERNSGKKMEVINREFYEKNRRQLGKTDDEREREFERMKRNARRCTKSGKPEA